MYQILVEHKADVMKQNYFDLVPFEMTTDEKFAEKYQEYFDNFED